MSCSSSVKTNTLVGVGVGETEMETLPVTADLAVSEQKVVVEVNGKVSDINILTQEALAQALWQGQPSVGGADVLVGQHAFTEAKGNDLKLTLTGYPAWYTNFRTATEADSLLLSMDRSGLSVENKPEIGSATSDGEWYFNVKYQFGDGYGWGLGAGKVWPSNLLKGDFFVGAEIEEGNILSPWKNECSFDSGDCSLTKFGGGLNIGGIYGELPNDLKLVYGLSLGLWASDYNLQYLMPRYSYYDGGVYWDMANMSVDEVLIAGPFVKLRWNNLELGLRLLFGFSETYSEYGVGGTISENITNFQFSIGYIF